MENYTIHQQRNRQHRVGTLHTFLAYVSRTHPENSPSGIPAIEISSAPVVTTSPTTPVTEATAVTSATAAAVPRGAVTRVPPAAVPRLPIARVPPEAVARVPPGPVARVIPAPSAVAAAVAAAAATGAAAAPVVPAPVSPARPPLLQLVDLAATGWRWKDKVKERVGGGIILRSWCVKTAVCGGNVEEAGGEKGTGAKPGHAVCD